MCGLIFSNMYAKMKDLLIVISGQAVGVVKTGCLDRLLPVVK